MEHRSASIYVMLPKNTWLSCLRALQQLRCYKMELQCSIQFLIIQDVIFNVGCDIILVYKDECMCMWDELLQLTACWCGPLNEGMCHAIHWLVVGYVSYHIHWLVVSSYSMSYIDCEVRLLVDWIEDCQGSSQMCAYKKCIIAVVMKWSTSYEALKTFTQWYRSTVFFHCISWHLNICHLIRHCTMTRHMWYVYLCLCSRWEGERVWLEWRTLAPQKCHPPARTHRTDTQSNKHDWVGKMSPCKFHKL